MYGWTFAIEDSASGALAAITQNMVAVTTAANMARPSVVAVGDVLNNVPNVAKTASARIADISTAVLDVQLGVEFLSYPLEALPERWAAIREEIVSTSVAIANGDWTTATASITAGINEGIGVVNDFRTTWDFTKQGFEGAKTIFTETWGLFSQNASAAISATRSVGSTLLTQTLPAVFSFVGQAVVSMASYTLSLFGATSAQAALNTVMLANPIGLVIVGIVAVGAAVAALIYYWDDVKSYLVSFAQFFIKNNPFSWIFDLVGYVFPEFKKSVMDTFSGIYDFIDTYFIKPIERVMSFLGEQMTGIKNDVNAALNLEAAPNQERDDYYRGVFGIAEKKGVYEFGQGQPASKDLSELAKEKVIGGASSDKKSTGKGLSIGKASAIEGGGNIKNISIRIDKLVEKIENNFNNASQMDVAKIKEVVTRALIDGVNDFNRQ